MAGASWGRLRASEDAGEGEASEAGDDEDAGTAAAAAGAGAGSVGRRPARAAPRPAPTPELRVEGDAADTADAKPPTVEWSTGACCCCGAEEYGSEGACSCSVAL